MPTENKTQSPYLTKLEAAEYLRISCRQLDRHADCGKVKKFKVGSKTLFRRDDLDEAVKPVTAANVGMRSL